MVSRAGNFDRLAAIFIELIAVVLLGFISAVPLAAQLTDRTETSNGAVLGPRHDGLIPPAIEPETAGVPVTADALLKQMSLAAGVIFAGQVTAVRRPPGFAGSGQDAAEGIVEIDLRVFQSLRGPAAGSIYTLREWTGLWAANSQRYKTGQNLLLFLYAPDAHGLSASVHGAEGAIPLRGSGVAPGPDDATVSAAEWLVDLRWIQAQTLRKQAYALRPVRNPIDPIPGRISEGNIALRAQSGFDDHSVPERSWVEPEGEPGLSPVRAIRRPRPIPAPAPVGAQPLSQVLALCQQALQLEAATLHATGAATRCQDAGR